MKWTPELTAQLLGMYAEGCTYQAMADGLKVSRKSVQYKLAEEKRAGRMEGLSNKRLKFKGQGVPDDLLATTLEDGRVIKLYAPRFARGFYPQVSARVKGVAV